MGPDGKMYSRMLGGNLVRIDVENARGENLTDGDLVEPRMVVLMDLFSILKMRMFFISQIMISIVFINMIYVLKNVHVGLAKKVKVDIWMDQ